jgi:hypothetical protein
LLPPNREPVSQLIDGPKIPEQVTSLVIGKLYAHLFFSHVIDFQGYAGINLAKIWPPFQFDMNTAWFPGLSDQDVLWLHEAFARESKPMPIPQ